MLNPLLKSFEELAHPHLGRFKALIGLLGAYLTLTTARAQSDYATPFDFVTIAGAAEIYGTADGTNAAAQFYNPQAVAVGANGSLYVVDSLGNTVRKIAHIGANWVVTTIAGNPSGGGSDGTNGNALFQQPSGIAIGASGKLYVADTYNYTIRQITPVGTNWVVNTIAGILHSNGSMDGTNSNAQFNSPFGITVDAVGNLYVADTDNHAIRKLTPVGTNWVVTTIAGTAGVSESGFADGTNGAAKFASPQGIVVDRFTNLYVADTGNNSIRQITPIGTNWVVTTIAGGPGFNDGTNQDAQFYAPEGIAVDTNDNLYVADTQNVEIRKISPMGTNWVTTTLAGSAGIPGTTDGSGTNALFLYPTGIAVDASGHVFVSDADAATIHEGSVAPLPSLSMSLSGTNILVSWPTSGAFNLQTNSDLTTANWGNYSGPVNTTNAVSSLTVSPSPATLFFRLAD
jgi:sugar lactone lactonase YvrE